MSTDLPTPHKTTTTWILPSEGPRTLLGRQFERNEESEQSRLQSKQEQRGKKQSSYSPSFWHRIQDDQSSYRKYPRNYIDNFHHTLALPNSNQASKVTFQRSSKGHFMSSKLHVLGFHSLCYKIISLLCNLNHLPTNFSPITLRGVSEHLDNWCLNGIYDVSI